MKNQPRSLRHGMLLNAQLVMDNAMPDLVWLKDLVPVKLHGELAKVLADFEDTLCHCDVASDYEEKS